MKLRLCLASPRCGLRMPTPHCCCLSVELLVAGESPGAWQQAKIPSCSQLCPEVSAPSPWSCALISALPKCGVTPGGRGSGFTWASSFPVPAVAQSGLALLPSLGCSVEL